MTMHTCVCICVSMRMRHSASHACQCGCLFVLVSAAWRVCQHGAYLPPACRPDWERRAACLLAVLLRACCSSMTYSPGRKMGFGLFLSHRQLRQLFPCPRIQTKNTHSSADRLYTHGRNPTRQTPGRRRRPVASGSAAAPTNASQNEVHSNDVWLQSIDRRGSSCCRGRRPVHLTNVGQAGSTEYRRH